MGLVLTIENNINSCNSRGIDEAFALDILPKLKNVKTKDYSSNLLHYVVSVYMGKYDKVIVLMIFNLYVIYSILFKDAGILAARCRLPGPACVVAASNVNFEEIEGDINNIN